MDTKILIIDGHKLLFQMFYGMPSRIVNKNGIAIQGVIGFVRVLIKNNKINAQRYPKTINLIELIIRGWKKSIILFLN